MLKPEPAKQPNFPMKRKRGTNWLVALILIVSVYTGLLYFHGSITGTRQLDGILGVLLGLFSCSQPAANSLEFILFGRYDPFYQSQSPYHLLWWGLNGLVLLAGLLLIVIALLRFTAVR